MPISASGQLLPSGPTGLKGLSPLGHLSQAFNDPVQEKRLLTQAAMELEALFINHLLKQMRRSLVETIAPKQQSGKGYQGLAEEHFTRALAAGGGLNLAQTLLTQLTPKTMPQAPENSHAATDAKLPGSSPGARNPSVPAAP
uniref:Flagellar protein FlgJ N-terminal domain-containing protein n=1 Tax=Desulfobacca acetoxidans TaxID=60893 RepID=A0A7C5ENI5_9BACT